MLFRPFDDANEFTRRAAHLGVEDVRTVSDTGLIYIFIAPDVPDEKRDAIRILATAQWPSREFVLGRRAKLQEEDFEPLSEKTVEVTEP